MNNRAISPRHVLSLAFFFGGLILVVLACGMLVNHSRLFSLKRDTAVMIGSTLPELTSSVALLEANVEAEKFFTENALASREELADVYMLPSESPAPRTVDVLTELAKAMRDEDGNTLSLDRVSFHANPEQREGFKAYTADVTLRGNFQLVASFLGVLGFSGDMMIKDVLSLDDRDTFLTSVEHVAPLSLRQAEDFLYLDLLAYAADPETRENRLFKDMPEAVVPDLKALLLRAGLADVRLALSHVASSLSTKNVWPLPLLTVDTAERSGNQWNITLTAYGR